MSRLDVRRASAVSCELPHGALMTGYEARAPHRRNLNYEHTHRLLLRTAVELIACLGVKALSLSALARASLMHRSTVYYHFDGRDVLIAAVRQWSAQQLSQGIDAHFSGYAQNGHISNFVLANPELIKLWIDDYIAAGDIRDRYPRWDSLVARTAQAFTEAGEDRDAEVYCALMLTGFFIAPLVFKNSVHPNKCSERIAERFALEQQRMLHSAGSYTQVTGPDLHLVG
jgi:AcrR family transcriptional regulator